MLPEDLIIMDKFDANRRKLLALGGVALGASFLPTQAFATLSTPRPRILTLNNLHTGESIKAEFFDGRGYIQDELAKLNHFSVITARIRSKASIPGLFDQLYRLQGLLGTRKPVQLVSGYRSVDTNNELREHSRGVAKKELSHQRPCHGFPYRRDFSEQYSQSCVISARGWCRILPQQQFCAY